MVYREVWFLSVSLYLVINKAPNAQLAVLISSELGKPRRCSKDGMGKGQRLVWDTGLTQVFLTHPQTTSTAPLKHGERKRNPTDSHFHQAILRMEKTANLEEFMDAEERTDSECSSGCQSGWTLYLGQSKESFPASRQQNTGKDEEDLSMLSDASSGPPLVHENNNNNSFCCCCCYNERDGCLCNDSFLTLTALAKYGDKRRSFEDQKQKERSFSLLEDTASSPVFSCYKAINNTNCSSKKLLNAEIMEQSFSLSENHLKRKIELQKQLGYLNSFCTCESSSGLQRRR